MTTVKRVGGEGSTRALLVDSTERIMLEDGYAAVTYRNVAAKAGVSLGAVQHHFPSIDDLFLAVVRQYSEREMETMLSELRAHPNDVLRVLWECSGNELSTALFIEIMALVNHRKSIQAEITEFAQKYRKVQLDALTENWDSFDLPFPDLTPAAMVLLLTCLPRWMRFEDAFGLSESTKDMNRLVQLVLEREVAPARRRRSGLRALDDKNVADDVHKSKTPLGAPATDRLAVLGTTLRSLGKRAASSARELSHYNRMDRRGRPGRDDGEMPDRR